MATAKTQLVKREYVEPVKSVVPRLTSPLCRILVIRAGQVVRTLDDVQDLESAVRTLQFHTPTRGDWPFYGACQRTARFDDTQYAIRLFDSYIDQAVDEDREREAEEFRRSREFRHYIKTGEMPS